MQTSSRSHGRGGLSETSQCLVLSRVIRQRFRGDDLCIDHGLSLLSMCSLIAMSSSLCNRGTGFGVSLFLLLTRSLVQQTIQCTGSYSSHIPLIPQAEFMKTCKSEKGVGNLVNECIGLEFLEKQRGDQRQNRSPRIAKREHRLKRQTHVLKEKPGQQR